MGRKSSGKGREDREVSGKIMAEGRQEREMEREKRS